MNHIEAGVTSTILVTGGAGYIGSHACKALRRSGFLPIAIDNFSNAPRETPSFGPCEEMDIRDTNRLLEVFHRHQPAAVMHFAGCAYVEESVRDPLKYYNNNVLGSLSLVEAMRRSGCRNLIFSSTCAVYGEPKTIPIAEEATREPLNPYGQTKKIVEDLLLNLDRSDGFRSILLRYFNAAGADPEGQLGECHDPETHLIPLCLAAAAQGTAMEVFGTDYPTRDGSCIRDYIHVTDLAEAHVMALRYLLREGITNSFNLGSGSGASVLEIIDTVREVTGHVVDIRLCGRRYGDPAVLLACIEKAKRTLQWQPRYTQLREIVSHAWRWHQIQQKNKFSSTNAPYASPNY